MKHIALVHFAYPPNIGGVEVLLKEYATILTSQGFHVSLFVGSGEEKNMEISCIVIPEFQSVMNTFPKLQKKILEKGIIDDEFYTYSATIEKKMNTYFNQQEVIIVHNMLTLVRNQPFIYAFRNYVKNHPDKKYIAWTHDHSYINEFKIKDLSQVVNSTMEKDLLTTTIPHVTYVTISETFKKPLIELMHLDHNEVQVIPDGINLKSFLEIDDQIWDFAQKHQLLTSLPLILSPVNILGRKNLDYCVDIVAELKKKYPHICYIITGNPSKHHSTIEYLNSLKKKVLDLKLSNNVIFLAEYFSRPMQNSEIHDLYDLSDIVFFLSQSENFGLPLVEASLTKTPIFVSDLDVFREVGKEYMEYLDWKKLLPVQAAQKIYEFIETNKRIQGHYRMRTTYNLETIIKEKLVPMLI